ncbi:COG3650 family protein [Paracoccus sp. 22332]|uniref:COG3650 family protein n=1 Tax=Paracoccus sp. 22332 TaxID=3453913 RepID=UPI003F85ED4D
MTPRLALIALMTLPLAACEGVTLPGLPTAAAPQVEGHKGPPGVSPLEQPIETGTEARPVSTAEAATYNTAAFSARGNEPFWAVDVAGSTAIYKTPDNQKGRAIRVNRLNFAQGVEYVGVHAGRPFVLNIRASECQDSMSGQDFPFTARLTVSGKTNAGCAGPAAPEVATAVAAIKAPAPAAPRATPVATRPAATRPAPTPAPAETAPAAPAATTPTPTATTPAPAATPAPASEGTGDLPPPPAAAATPDSAPASPAAETGASAPIVPELRTLPPAGSTGAASDSATPTPTEPAE